MVFRRERLTWYDSLELGSGRKEVEGGKNRVEIAMGELLLIYFCKSPTL